MIYMTSAKIMQSPSGQEISLDFFFYPLPLCECRHHRFMPPSPSPNKTVSASKYYERLFREEDINAKSKG